MALIQVFGENLRDQRNKNGLTQAELAAKADLHVSYISALENARRNISLGNLERIAQCLNVDPYTLLIPKEDN